MIFKYSNGISKQTVFEMRMRTIDLAVDHTNHAFVLKDLMLLDKFFRENVVI